MKNEPVLSSLDMHLPPFAEQGTKDARRADAIRRASLAALAERLPQADERAGADPRWLKWRPQIIENIQLILALHIRPLDWVRAAELAGYISDPFGPVERVIRGGAPPPVMVLDLLMRATVILRGHRIWSDAPTYAERKLIWSGDNTGCPALYVFPARSELRPAPRWGEPGYTGGLSKVWAWASPPACPPLGEPCPTAAGPTAWSNNWSQPAHCTQMDALRALAAARRVVPGATVQAQPCPFSPSPGPCIPGGYDCCAECSWGYHASKK